MNIRASAASVACLAILPLCRADGLGGRPVSWDIQGTVPIEYIDRYSAKDPLIGLLQQGETQQVRSLSLKRMGKDSQDLVAAWCYGQAARVRNDGEAMLREVRAQLTDEDSPSRVYAEIKCLQVTLQKLLTGPSPDPKVYQPYQNRLSELAHIVLRKHRTSIPLLLSISFMDEADPAGMHDAVDELLKQHPDDYYTRVVAMKLLLSGDIGWGIDANGKKIPHDTSFRRPEEPKPQRVLEKLSAYLKEKPGDWRFLYIKAFALNLLKDKKGAILAGSLALKNPFCGEPVKTKLQSFIDRGGKGGLGPSIRI